MINYKQLRYLLEAGLCCNAIGNAVVHCVVGHRSIATGATTFSKKDFKRRWDRPMDRQAEGESYHCVANAIQTITQKTKIFLDGILNKSALE